MKNQINMSRNTKKYTIQRPPLSPNFSLPTLKELLKINKGDLVKIMLQVKGDRVERMWVKIIKQQDFNEWTGILKNKPIQYNTSQVLRHGDRIIFHPLDIIEIQVKRREEII